MIKHDYKFIHESLDGLSPHCEELAVDLATEYLEHWLHWRHLDELPNIGDRVEILEHGTFGGGVTYSHIFNNNLPDDAVAWRPSPLGALPDVIDQS